MREEKEETKRAGIHKWRGEIKNSFNGKEEGEWRTVKSWTYCDSGVAES